MSALRLDTVGLVVGEVVGDVVGDSVGDTRCTPFVYCILMFACNSDTRLRIWIHTLPQVRDSSDQQRGWELLREQEWTSRQLGWVSGCGQCV
jgi:hypothetical protein